MKKLFTAVILLLAVQLSSAQSADFKKDAIEAVKLSGATANFSAYSEAIMEQIADETKKIEFKRDFDATLPNLYDKMADAFMKNYTHEDIKKIINFYNSEIGKKIQKTTPQILKEQGPITQEWQTQLQGLLMKYFQQ